MFVRVYPRPGSGNRIVIDIGCIDLDPELLPGRIHLLPEEHGERIRLLTGSAAGDPDTEGVVLGFIRKQGGEDFPVECFEGFPVPEETGHVDEQLLEEDMDLGGIFLEVPGIRVHIFELMHAHPPFDPAPDGALLVLGEVVPGFRAQEHQDPAHGAHRFRSRRGRAEAGIGDGLYITDQLLHDLFDRENVRGKTALNCAGRHAVIFCR